MWILHSHISIIEKLSQSFLDAHQMKDDQGILPIRLCVVTGRAKVLVLPSSIPSLSPYISVVQQIFETNLLFNLVYLC